MNQQRHTILAEYAGLLYLGASLLGLLDSLWIKANKKDYPPSRKDLKWNAGVNYL